MSDIRITIEERNGRRCASSGSKWEPIMGVEVARLIDAAALIEIEADAIVA